MKLFSRVVYLMILLCDLTVATAQEFRLSGSLLTREKWTGPVNGFVSYTYDDDLAVATRRVNARAAVAFSHDADKLLTGAGDLTITRNPQNGLITRTAIGGISDSWSYNEFGELTDYSFLFGTTPLYTGRLVRDALGHAIARTETIGGVTNEYAYTYDAADRLSIVTLNGATNATYTYDANGNRLGVADDGGPRNGTYDDQDRLMSFGAAAYIGTPNGELATKDIGGQVASYTYDVFGNLLHAGLPNGTAIDYLVDGRNRRVGKKVNGGLGGGAPPPYQVCVNGCDISQFAVGRETENQSNRRDARTRS